MRGAAWSMFQYKLGFYCKKVGHASKEQSINWAELEAVVCLAIYMADSFSNQHYEVYFSLS